MQMAKERLDASMNRVNYLCDSEILFMSLILWASEKLYYFPIQFLGITLHKLSGYKTDKNSAT